MKQTEVVSKLAAQWNALSDDQKKPYTENAIAQNATGGVTVASKGPVIKTKKGFQMGVRIIVPPYPFDDPATFDSFSKNAVILFHKPNYDGVHFEDAKMEKGEWLVAGEAGVVLTITGSGLTMKQAQKHVYNRVSNLMIPNMYYRTDIGDRWYEDSDKLNTWGYLRDS
jgi:phosphoribosylamine--glycine ligase